MGKQSPSPTSLFLSLRRTANAMPCSWCLCKGVWGEKTVPTQPGSILCYLDLPLLEGFFKKVLKSILYIAFKKRNQDSLIPTIQAVV